MSFVARASKVSPLALYAIAYGGSAALQKGIGFVIFLWLAHSLTVEEYATFGLLFALQTGLAAMAGAGIIESVVGLLKEHKKTPSRLRLFGAANAVFAILAAAATAIIASTCGALSSFAEASIPDLFYVTAGGLAMAFFTFQAHLTRLEEDHAASVALSFFPPMAGWVVGFAAFSVVQSVSAFFAGLAAGLVICLIAFRLARIGFYAFATHLNETLPILSRISPFILIVVLVWLSGYGNTYLVKSFFNEVDVARFTFAYTLSAIMQLVATSLNQVWSPRFFRIVHEVPVAEVERASGRFFTLQGLALGLVGGLVLAVVPLATKLVGSSLAAYQGLNTELFLLFAAYALSIPWYHVQNYYFAHGRGKELMNLTLVTSSLGMLSWVCVMWLLGVIGVYLGFMLLMATRMLGTVIWARREWAVDTHYEGPAVAMLLLAAGALASAPLANLIP